MQLFLTTVCFAIVLAFCSGCESFYPACDDYTYDSRDWNREQVKLIQAAAENWNVFAGHEVMSVSEGYRDHCQIVIVESLDKPGKHIAHNGNIDIKFSAVKDFRLTRVLEHEMGHALGLDHVEDPDSIMSAALKPSTKTWSSADYQECSDLGVCD